MALFFAAIVLVLLWQMIACVVDPATALKKIVTVTFNSVTVGIVESINGVSPNQWVKLKGQGKLGFGSTGLVGRDCEVTLTWYGGDFVAVDGTTVGDLVVTMYEQDGATTRVMTWANMKADDYNYSHNDDAPPTKCTQKFHVVDDMDTDNFSIV